MVDIILTLIIITVVGSASLKMISDNKKGKKCSGCPYADLASNGKCSKDA